MDLAERRSMTLSHQRELLRSEFEDWRSQSEWPASPMAKHRSQIRRITGVLERLLNDAPAGTGSFEDSERLLACLLFAQRTWAYFRDKFAQRTVRVLQDTLKCTDEFAWECYAPARQRALEARPGEAGRLKVPPLTFFSSAAAPFIQRRETVFQAEGITSEDAAQFDFEMKQLPIPLIGVPWQHANFLPCAVVVAHEVGHAVEADFRIAGVLDRVLTGLAEVDARRRPGWLAWRKELFADIYAVLCAGPAYVLALADYLVGPPAAVVNEHVDSATWATNLTENKPYPTRSLRLAFNLEVLEQLGLEDAGLGRAWEAAYPPATWGDYAAFRADTGHVVKALLNTPLPTLGNVPITGVIGTTPDGWQAITRKAGNLTEGEGASLTRKRGDDSDEPLFRGWFAAATWAYRCAPEAYMTARGGRSLAATLVQAIPVVTRAEPGRDSDEGAALVAAQAAADQATARALLERVLSAT